MGLETIEVESGPKPFPNKHKVDWTNRLQICTDQLRLAFEFNHTKQIEYWLHQGFEASENCVNIIDKAEGLAQRDIDHINKKITNFKTTCKND